MLRRIRCWLFRHKFIEDGDWFKCGRCGYIPDSVLRWTENSGSTYIIWLRKGEKVENAVFPVTFAKRVSELDSKLENTEKNETL